jgi:hypothetical protein
MTGGGCVGYCRCALPRRWLQIACAGASWFRLVTGVPGCR